MSPSEFNEIFDAIKELTAKVEGYHVQAATTIAKIETRCEERHEKQPQSTQRSWATAGVVAAIAFGVGSFLVSMFKHVGGK